MRIMASTRQFSSRVIFAVVTVLTVTMANAIDISLTGYNPGGQSSTYGNYGSKLNKNYYDVSCPNLLSISKQITEEYVRDLPAYAPGLLRMIFHDCFVTGCDASVLLDSTPENKPTEKDAVPNSTLKGFEVINAIKAKLEEVCPNVVSCADVLALASRDAVFAINGPYWDVPFGRKDGKSSLATEANNNLPSPFADIVTLKENFRKKGFSPKELAILSGAHTIGRGHCFILQDRLYNYKGFGITDPTMDRSYASDLKTQCPRDANNLESSVGLDYTPGEFDSVYYEMVAHRKGLFESDAALMNDLETGSYVYSQALSHGRTFGEDFGKVMVKLIGLGVLTGDQGEIRTTCGAVRSYY